MIADMIAATLIGGKLSLFGFAWIRLQARWEYNTYWKGWPKNPPLRMKSGRFA